MPLRIRLARAGAKKRPHYRIVVTDGRNPRDGRFLERVGTYSPLLPKDSDERITMKVDRIKYWMDRGAQPSDRVRKFLAGADLVPKPVFNNPEKAKPKAKAQARLDEQKQAAEEAASAAEAPDAGDATDAAEAPASE